MEVFEPKEIKLNKFDVIHFENQSDDCVGNCYAFDGKLKGKQLWQNIVNFESELEARKLYDILKKLEKE